MSTLNQQQVFRGGSFKGRSIFGSKIREKILTLLYLNKEKELYLREIAGNIGASAGTVQREIRNLQQMGVVSTRRSGNRVYYSLNKGNPIYKELASIVKKQGGLVGELKKGLMGNKDIKICFIYGSYVSAKDTAESDIDLFVIGEIKGVDLAVRLRVIEKDLGREISPYVITEGELKKKLKQKGHFLRAVIKAEKLFIKGNDDKLQKIIR